MQCRFCNKFCKNENSLRNHERLCKLNPNKQILAPKSEKWKNSIRNRKTSNQFLKAKQMGSEVPVVKKETRKKISAKSKMQIWTKERKFKHSESMKFAVKTYPESYSSSNRGRVKQIIFEGIKFQGKWELDFYNYCRSNNIEIRRSNEWFEYEWNGIRKYFPDFYLPTKDFYVEVKGYETERDRAKWAAFPKNLMVVKEREIKLIRNGLWNFGDCSILAIHSAHNR